MVVRFIITLSVFVCIIDARAESFPAGAHVRAEYVRLRNVDPSGDQALHAPKWIVLANDMNYLYLKSPAAMPGRDLLFAADTNLRVFRYNRSPGYLARAKANTESLLERSPGSSREYGEALMLRGDLGIADKESNDTVLAWYKRAAQIDPRLVRRSQERVHSLNNGTFIRFLPSVDLEIPRPVPLRKGAPRAITKRIVIDPGHGGFDSGAGNDAGLLEKDVTLDIAKRVKTKLETDTSIAVYLTRTDDVFVPLARRTDYANRKNGDAFVSLHLNASPGHQLKGLEAYYLDTTDDEASRLLAERENGLPPGGALDDLSFILSDLIQSGKLEESVELAHYLESAVHKTTRSTYRDATSYGVKKGPFFVLVGAHMPCALIELFFIDSPLDGAKLATDGFRTILAEGLASGLSRFAFGGPAMESSKRPSQSKKAKPLKKKKQKK